MSSPSFFERSELTRALWMFRREFMLVVVLSMVANVLMLAPTLYMLQVYDRVMVSQSKLTLLLVSLITLFLLAVMATSEWLRSRVLVLSGNRLDSVLSSRVFHASFDASVQKGDSIASRSFGDLLQLRQFVTGQGIFAFCDTPWTPVYLAVLFLLHPVLGWTAIGFALVQAALVWFGHRGTIAPAKVAQEAQRESSEYLHGKLRHVESLVPMGMVDKLRVHWKARYNKALATNSELHDVSERVSAVSKFVRYTQQSLALGVGALLVIDGELSPGAMIAANVLMTRALAPIDSLVNTWKGFIGAKAAFARLEKLLQDQPARDFSLARMEPKGHLQLKNVKAMVPEREQPILKGVSLEVQPATVTVVVGPSGSGKSTLARCMVGIWPHWQGEVLLDGRPLNGWGREELGPHLGYLPQDIELFEGSIAENIARMGKVDSNLVIAAAQAAGLHEMILHFPKGYDTPIGEAGGMLSGGQRQRIGLARAMYGNPKLVVLDEPNANLDDVGEAALAKAVVGLKARGCAVVMISHRPGALSVADQVVVLEDGKLKAVGPRDEVLKALRTAGAAASLSGSAAGGTTPALA